MDSNESIVKPKRIKYQPNKYETNPHRCLEAFEEYCKHMEAGYKRQAFFFSTDDFIISYKTLDNYMKDMPDIFPLEEFERSQAAGQLTWEKIAEDCALAKKPHNTATLQMVMRNKCGWDKKETVETDFTTLKAVFAHFAIAREQLEAIAARQIPAL